MISFISVLFLKVFSKVSDCSEAWPVYNNTEGTRKVIFACRLLQETRQHSNKNFVRNVKSNGSTVAETPACLLTVEFQEIFSLDSQNFCDLKGESIHKYFVSEKKKCLQHNCPKKFLIWRKCSFDWRVSDNYVRLMKVWCFKGK